MVLRAHFGFSLLALAALTPAAASTGRSTICGSPPTGWKTSQPNKTQVVNTVAIRKEKGTVLTWNGASVTPRQLREYVQITKSMNPSPTLLLIVSPSAECGEVRRLREMIQETLRCENGQCVEIGA
jgi:hypothetical protein